MGIVVKSFKDQFSSDERLKESKNILAKYPDRVPVIIEKYPDADLPDMEKNKLVSSKEMAKSMFQLLVRTLTVFDSTYLASNLIFVVTTIPPAEELLKKTRELE